MYEQSNSNLNIIRWNLYCATHLHLFKYLFILRVLIIFKSCSCRSRRHRSTIKSNWSVEPVRQPLSKTSHTRPRPPRRTIPCIHRRRPARPLPSFCRLSRRRDTKLRHRPQRKWSPPLKEEARRKSEDPARTSLIKEKNFRTSTTLWRWRKRSDAFLIWLEQAVGSSRSSCSQIANPGPSTQVNANALHSKLDANSAQ